ncbi:NADPH-dependent FMN reductase, partial [Salmonella enterica]
MNVLGISGSLRQASFNTALLHAAQELAPAGMNIIIHRLHDLPLFNQDVEEQGDPAPVVEFKQAIERADGLL